MDMGEENLRIWFQSVDLDNSGTISSTELQQALEAGNMRFGLPTVTQMIRNRGFLPLNDVYMALQQLEYSLDQPAFYTVCQSFDSKNTGKFLLNDFICLCVFLQSARNLFQSFDRTKQGRVTFDFNQFVYCSANLRLN